MSHDFIDKSCVRRLGVAPMTCRRESVIIAVRECCYSRGERRGLRLLRPRAEIRRAGLHSRALITRLMPW